MKILFCYSLPHMDFNQFFSYHALSTKILSEKVDDVFGKWQKLQPTKNKTDGN